MNEITVTYDPAVADPNETDGTYIWTGTAELHDPALGLDGGFDFTPGNGEATWSIMAGEIARGIVTIDPKQVS